MTRLRPATRLAALPALAALLAACGARGAPRPPLIILPDTISTPEATRLADRVYLEFDAPDSDTDGTTPGDIEWIEVYALTTQPQDLRPREEFSEDWLDAATLIAVLPVRLPEDAPAAEPTDASSEPEPEHEPETETDLELADVLEEVQNREAATGPVAFFEVVQGEAVTVVERLTPETLVPVTVGDPDDPDEDEDDEETEEVLPIPLVSPPAPEPPIRSYVAFAVSSRNRLGEPSDLVDVPLVTPPPPPGPVAVSYDAGTIEIVWEEPPTFRLPVQAEEVEPPALASTPVVEGPEPSAYAVYDLEASGDPDVERPQRLGAPDSEASHTDGAPTFPETRCYAVRVLDYVASRRLQNQSPGAGLQLLGDASPATCVVLTDTFPPAAPTGVIAVADTTGISLVWDENGEEDLAGYVVLRGTPPDATLQPLTVEPLVETAFQDTDVTAGRRYVYQVLALDTAVPPNASPPSEPVTEIAR